MESPSQPQPDHQPEARMAEVVRPGPAKQPQVVYMAPASHPFLRWLSWMGWVGCFLAVSVILGMSATYREYFDNSGGIQEKFHSGEEGAQAKIAIIRVEGMIGVVDSFVKKQIERIKDDPKVKGVVVRVDSPGGTITGSDYILHHLRELKKERGLDFVVSMGSIAASGGYYVSMAVDDVPNSIFAEPTTTTGSIGVIIPHYDVSGLLARFDIQDDSLVSHPRKRMLSMTRPIREEDRVVLEAYLNDAFTRFKDVIKSGRPVFREDEAKLDELATGEIFTANQALQHGLVDQLGFIEDAIARAAELASLEKGEYRAVQYKAPLTLMDAFTSAQANATTTSPLGVQAALEMSVPKAYYVATSLPPLLSRVNAPVSAD